MAKGSIKKLLYIIIILFWASWASAADYTVTTGTSTVDGDTFCGGSACTSSDTIIIAGGARGNLLFQDFNGNGSYITIKNENGDSKVSITSDDASGWAVLSFSNCKYIDFKGNNDVDYTYGIYVNHTDADTSGTTVWFYNDCDYIKFSYVEITHTKSSTSALALQTGENNEGSSTVYDTLEFNNLYIHDIEAQGLYIGKNQPDSNQSFIANVKIHDNLIEDIDAYGMTVKGIKSTSSYVNIYNNTIKRIGANGTTDSGRQGISVSYNESTTSIQIYSNWIEKTYGSCIQAMTHYVDIYNNAILGCGINDAASYNSGISSHYVDVASNYIDVYDNIILQPVGYGIQATASTTITSSDRNKIGDTGDGYYEESGTINQGTGADADITYADVADFYFDMWSDDEDYSNDVFGGRNLNPVNGGTNVGSSVTLTGTLFTGVSSYDMLYSCVDSTPDNPDDLVVDDGTSSISYDPDPDPGLSTTCYWQNIYTMGFGVETGDVYSFTTTFGPPAVSTSFGGIKHSIHGGNILSK